MKALLARKIGMAQSYGSHGKVEPVTLLVAGPCTVTQIKTADKDGYSAIQVGLGEAKKPGKTASGHLKASGAKSEVLREFRMDDLADLKVGDKLDVNQFEVGQTVNIAAISKGKGFAGVIKRHNFQRGPKSHGTIGVRGHGSIGSMYPQKVFKGKRMAGRMGQDQVTLKQVKIIDVDPADNILAVQGPIPGPRRGLITIWS